MIELHLFFFFLSRHPGALVDPGPQETDLSGREAFAARRHDQLRVQSRDEFYQVTGGAVTSYQGGFA